MKSTVGGLPVARLPVARLSVALLPVTLLPVAWLPVVCLSVAVYSDLTRFIIRLGRGFLGSRRSSACCSAPRISDR